MKRIETYFTTIFLIFLEGKVVGNGHILSTIHHILGYKPPGKLRMVVTRLHKTTKNLSIITHINDLMLGEGDHSGQANKIRIWI